jgi:aspartate aminotransferase
MADADLIESLSRDLRRLPPSEIRATMEAGSGLEGVVPLWFGESDEPTPDFIKAAAIAAIGNNDTRYGSSAGQAELVDAARRYTARHYGFDPGAQRVLPTASGLQGIMMSLQALIEPDDKFVVLGPTWPNVRNAALLAGASMHHFNLTFSTTGGWQLDLDALFASMGTDTKVLCINSPANPTGWVAREDELRTILEYCRRNGTWLLSDEVYSRLYFRGPRAPSFLDVADEEDRLVIVNSFSKAWNMTGWRLGWLVVPRAVHGAFTQTIENNIANVPTFVQRAGIAALDQGDEFVAGYQQRLADRRARSLAGLSQFSRVSCAPPDGAFYVFFSVDGVSDSVEFSRDLLKRTRVGMAPGRAFGDGLESWLRLSFACSEARLDEAFSRLAPELG